MYLAPIEPGSYLDFATLVPFADENGVEHGVLNEAGRISRVFRRIVVRVGTIGAAVTASTIPKHIILYDIEFFAYEGPMNDVESALQDIARIREQLAASTRFQGFAPPIVAATGAMAAALAVWQSVNNEGSLAVWVLLAAVSVLMIGTEAIVRARRLHRAMADRLLSTTLQRFMPTALAGAILGLVVLVRAPEFSRLLPGAWQLLLGVGIFAVQTNLPRAIIWAAGFYFLCGTISLALANDPGVTVPWLMGLPFGIGQVLVAAILHHGAKEAGHA
jgi:hypothetical protein